MSLETDLEATEATLRATLTARIADVQTLLDDERAHQRKLKATFTAGPNGRPHLGLYYDLTRARAVGESDRTVAIGNARAALKAARDAMNAADATRWELLSEGKQIAHPLPQPADPVELVTAAMAQSNEKLKSDYAPTIGNPA